MLIYLLMVSCLKVFGTWTEKIDKAMIFKKKFHYFFSSAYLKLSGKDQNVPNLQIYLSFKSKFRTATFVQWNQIDVFKWQVKFIHRKKEHSALFDSQGNWLETISLLPFQITPVGVRESFARNYNIKGLQCVHHIKRPDNSIFEIQWSDGVFVKKLLFDRLGKIKGKLIT